MAHSRVDVQGARSGADAAQLDTGAKGRRRLLGLVVLAIMVPAYFSLGSLVLTPSKVLFLILTPVMTVNLIRGKYGRFRITDAFIFAYILWMGLAMLANHSPLVAIEYMGSTSIILLGGYVTARATIRTKDDFIFFIKLIAFLVVLSLPFAIYESITSRTTIPRWIALIPGLDSHSDIQHDPRFGLWRTQWVFTHPIHYGLFCSMAFSLVLIGMGGSWGTFRRVLVSAIVGICTFLSVSSGPFLAVMAQIGLIAWAVSMRWTGIRWKLFGWLALVGYIIIELASTRPGIYAVVERLAFNPATAFDRRVLFQYGMQQIYRTPTMGVGYNPWPLPFWMTGSVDNFWLLLAVVFGVPTFLFFAGAFLSAMILVGRRDLTSRPDLLPLRLAWVFTMISLALSLGTVAIWGELYSLVLLMLGSGMWMASAEPASALPAVVTEELPGSRPATRYTRFPNAKPSASGGRLRAQP